MAVYLWRGTANNYDWNTAANWSPAGVPGVEDTATFDGSSPKRCNMLTSTVILKRLEMQEGFAGGVIKFSGRLFLTSPTDEPSLLVAGSLRPLFEFCRIFVGGAVYVGGGDIEFTGGKVKAAVEVVTPGYLKTLDGEEIGCGSDITVGNGGYWDNLASAIQLTNGASVYINYGGVMVFTFDDEARVTQRIAGESRWPLQAFYVEAGEVFIQYRNDVSLRLPLVMTQYGSLTVYSTELGEDSTGTLVVTGGNRASGNYSVNLSSGAVLQFVHNAGGEPVIYADDVYATDRGTFVGHNSTLRFMFHEFITNGRVVCRDGLIDNVSGLWNCNGPVQLFSGAVFAGSAGDVNYSECRVFASAEGPASFFIGNGSLLQYTMAATPPPEYPPATAYNAINANIIDGDFSAFIFANGLWAAGPTQGPTLYQVTYSGPTGGG